MGKVYLIGAGPGDEGLISLKAVNAIKKSDILLYDRLAPKGLLRFAKDDAEIYYCGKRPDNHYKSQEEINEILIQFANRGKTVGRIKGGDPYVFGRGGEEALALFEEGIEFETISGVTSPVAVLNYAGIPITHRKQAQSFHIYTGMSAEQIDIDWELVAKQRGTLVFMMGLAKLDGIVKNLLKYGKPKDTPSAVIMNGTKASQKIVIGSLENISEKVKLAKLKSPCIIAFGDNVKLSEKLNWYSRKPLSGLNICITRSKKQSLELRERLYDLGAEITEINSIEIERIDNGIDPFIDKLSGYDYIILNSVNAVEIFFEELIERKIDIRNISAKFPAIGKKTAEALEKRGIIPSIIAKDFTLEGLYDSMKNSIKKNERALFPKSENGRDYLIKKFEAKGVKVDSFSLYRTVTGKIRGYENLKDVDIVIFTSPSTFKNTIEIFGKSELEKKILLSIGPITEKAIRSKNLDCIVSDNYSIDGIIEKLIDIKKNGDGIFV
ncbi:MAG: uroporphyrinogen-III C-methyltransferase [Andreesenia angusta]|nr:uroporphyrinogen-III C-methyltransferase [Andreesenia angusta]